MHSAACRRCFRGSNMHTAAPAQSLLVLGKILGAAPAPCSSPLAHQDLGALKNEDPHPHQGPLMRHGCHCVFNDATKPLRSAPRSHLAVGILVSDTSPSLLT